MHRVLLDTQDVPFGSEPGSRGGRSTGPLFTGQADVVRPKADATTAPPPLLHPQQPPRKIPRVEGPHVFRPLADAHGAHRQAGALAPDLQLFDRRGARKVARGTGNRGQSAAKQ